MMLIDCPECGPRDEFEFHYGGQAHVTYPAAGGADLTDEEWAGYLFFRDNPKGAFAERWVHSGGCRRWFNAVRDTLTYEFLAVYRSGQPRPRLPGEHHTHSGGGDRTDPAGAGASNSPTLTGTPSNGSGLGDAEVPAENLSTSNVSSVAAHQEVSA